MEKKKKKKKKKSAHRVAFVYNELSSGFNLFFCFVWVDKPMVEEDEEGLTAKERYVVNEEEDGADANSCSAVSARLCSFVGVVMLLVALLTPSWVLQTLKVPRDSRVNTTVLTRAQVERLPNITDMYVLFLHSVHVCVRVCAHVRVRVSK